MNYISPWIYTSYNCNLKCNYCYIKQCKTEISDLTLQQIDIIFSKLLDIKELDFVIWRIAGGEPLLNFNKWNKTFSNFKNKYPDKSFISIITNLTKLNNNMIHYFRDNNCGFGISLDGYSFSKPYKNNKTSSFDVMKNIETLLYLIGNKNIDISTVFNYESIKDCEKLAKFILKNNLNWGIYLDHYYSGKIDYNYLLTKIYSIIDILNEGNYDLLNKFKFNNIKLSSNYDGCQAGKNLIAIGCNGEIWPCQTSLYNKSICKIEDFSINKLKEQYVYNIGYNFKLKEECNNCSLKNACNGGCKLHNNSEFTCNIIKNIIFYLLKTITKEV